MPKDKTYMTLWRDAWSAAGIACVRECTADAWRAYQEAFAESRDSFQQLKREITKEETSREPHT